MRRADGIGERRLDDTQTAVGHLNDALLADLKYEEDQLLELIGRLAIRIKAGSGSSRINAMGGAGSKRTQKPRGSGSWNVLSSAFHAFSGLMWVAPRTPSLRLGFVVVIALAAGGVLLRFTGVEIALLVLLGTVLLAVETLNTAIEMLCDYVQPQRDPKIGKIKDVAAGATAVTEIGAAVVVAVLIWPHLLAFLHR